MSFRNLRSARRIACGVASRRRGMIATGEVTVVLVSLMGLFWLGSQLLSIVEMEPAANEAITRGCSERRVYRISVDADGQRMWIYRPMDGITHLNLQTGAVDGGRSTLGMEVYAVAHSGDGESSLVCSLEGTVVLYRGTADVLMSRCGTSGEMVVDAALSKDGTVAVCISPSGHVCGWSIEGETVKEISYELTSGPAITRMGLSKSGRRMCVVDSDGRLAIHDVATGVREPVIAELATTCNAIAWSDDEQQIVVASNGGFVRLLDSTTLSVVWKSSHGALFDSTCPTTVTISPDGGKIAMATNNLQDIYLWTTGSAEPAQLLKGHLGVVRTLQFTPDSSRILSGSYDGTIREWSVDTGSEIRVVD